MSELVWTGLAVLTGLAFLALAAMAIIALMDRDGVRARIVARYPLRTATAALILPPAALAGFGLLVSTVQGWGDMTGLALVGVAVLAGCVAVVVVAHVALRRGLGPWRWMVALTGWILPSIAAILVVDPHQWVLVVWLLTYGLACGGNGMLLAWRGARENTSATSR